MSEEICESCGHVGSWHSDGTYTHTGACNVKLNDEKDDVNKMVFCKCKKYIKQKIIKENKKMKKKKETLSDEIEKMGNAEFLQVRPVKQTAQNILEDIDKEFIRAEKGIPAEVASVLYVFKQVIKGKIKERFGRKLI